MRTGKGIMDEARTILSSLDVPEKQTSGICCLTLAAMAHVTKERGWSEATNDWIRIHDIIGFLKTEYNVAYAENSRETIRKQALHHFRNAAFVEDNGKATNSPDYRYRLTSEMLALVQSYGTEAWAGRLRDFADRHEALKNAYASRKRMRMMPIRVNGKDLDFSPGRHNELQKSVVEVFAPRFAPGCECLYIGDTIKKNLVKNQERLSSLGFDITLHDKMPDVVLYMEDRKLVLFVECVTSSGPMDPKRVKEIQEMTSNVKDGKVFLTAFPNLKVFKSFLTSLAWETEVWIADIPDHIIHMNGEGF